MKDQLCRGARAGKDPLFSIASPLQPRVCGDTRAALKSLYLSPSVPTALPVTGTATLRWFRCPEASLLPCPPALSSANFQRLPRKRY